VSELPRIAIAAEGPTDLPIIAAALDAVLGEVTLSFLQPPGDSIDATTPGGHAGEYGGGWKGVRTWCQQARASGQWAAVLSTHRMVVVHVDADIAGDPEIGVEKPCPPPSDTCDAVRQIVTGWIGGPLEPKCVLCVPSKASDAWLAAALSLVSGAVECDPNPALWLRSAPGRPKAVTGAKPDKYAAGYRRLAPSIRTAWHSVKAICTEAARFEADVLAVP
jgi:hypothetical protein